MCDQLCRLPYFKTAHMAPGGLKYRRILNIRTILMPNWLLQPLCQKDRVLLPNKAGFLGGKVATSHIGQIIDDTYLQGCCAESHAHFELGMSGLKKNFGKLLT